MRTIGTLIFICLVIKLSAQPLSVDLQITHLTGNFYVFTTFNAYNGSRIPANGMYLVTNEGVAMFDTPWDTTQFQPLLDSIKARHNQDVVLCIATHFHEDRTGGFEYYRQQGIKTYTTRLTDSYSKEKGKHRAQFLITNDTVFRMGGYSFRTYYPGPGHTPDNIVIWFGNEKILYGGCLIKSLQDSNLGNLGDANVESYALTVKNVLKKCRDPRFVIPGHNDWRNTRSLNHTLKMAQELKDGRH
ncbi:MAG TPA: BlaB/IND/MUS family subclass B1 metallo-beta-lactamase [Ohtaekwangia sp.]|nr:BlaB/IND/MUS family subclass B1 metallo-beta-lactamase [Ohtaekwangia sp.]